MLLAVALAVTAVGLGACESSAGCTPTTTEAVDADRVDLASPGDSSTLSATLTVSSSGEALPGKTLRFAVLDDGSEVYSTEGSTGGDGSSRVDLKRVDAGALQGLARGDEFRASFAGDATYCSSSGDAVFTVTRAPGGVSVTTP
ncbi:MAG TPA: hypothetical protein VF230_05435 [Acidimicrobiales bacterium]